MTVNIPPMKEKISNLKNAANQKLRQWCDNIPLKCRGVVVVSMLVVFAGAFIVMMVAPRNGTSIEIEHIKTLELNKLSEKDSLLGNEYLKPYLK